MQIKMDENNLKIRPLNMDQVNKKIISKEPYIRPEYDLLNPTGNYQDEDYKMYQEKRSKFFEISKKYREFNEQTFVSSKIKTQKDYENYINEHSGHLFDKEKVETESDFIKNFYNKMNNYENDGKRERRRLLRNIHERLHTETADYCIEPWFKRYLILNKFIHYSRAIILKNRLLRNLDKLKALNEEKIEELEHKHLKYKNQSYAELFEKFL